MKISVVLITKNQEFNIERLLTSVLREVGNQDIDKIILVDSASTDNTITIASRFPVTIIKIVTALRYSASAGRYIGAKYSHGDCILFLDGDMELLPGWVDDALKIIAEDPAIGVITSPWINIYPGESTIEKQEISHQTRHPHNIGGAGLYRKSALEKAGSFNPCLYSDEEPALLLNLQRLGYRHIKTNHPMVNHYEERPRGFGWLMRRRQKNLWVGIGQNIRHFWGTELFFPYLRQRGFGCVVGIWWILALLSVLIFFFIHDVSYLVALLSATILFLLFDIRRRKSIYATFYSIIQRILILEATIKGMFLMPVAPKNYWANIKIINGGYERL